MNKIPYKTYEEFKERFGWNALKELKDNDLALRLFADKFYNEGRGLLCWLEYGGPLIETNTGKGDFGSASNLSRNSIIYKSEDKTFIQLGQKGGYVSNEHANKVADEYKKKLSEICMTVEDFIFKDGLTNINGYKGLYDALIKKGLKTEINQVMYLKYLHMLYPDYFCEVYKMKKQKGIISILGGNACSFQFVNSGEISLIAKKKEVHNYNLWDYCYSNNFNNTNNELDNMESQNEENSDLNKETKVKEGSAYNRIIFGAPGTGKSHKLGKETQNLKDGLVERVTFHPDYSYANFVGCYKPVMVKNGDKKDIEYDFIAGPFLEVYRNAKKNPDKHYVLIIEEINRANVAAVFGDVFQLLDRKDGVSKYPITASQDVKKWLIDNSVNEEKLCIPNNMYIWATMNSADQGVYPMDTAFKRRWTFEYVGINDDKRDGVIKLDQSNQEVEWNKIREAINNVLLDANVNEDKCLGPFFLSEKDLEDTTGKIFASKVLMYLFEDVVKQKPSKVFNLQKYKGFSAIYNGFIGKEGFDVFIESISREVTKNQPGKNGNE